MFYDRQDIVALISSRICHDLISPLGAISNGIELLEMAGLAKGPEMELISQSITNANSKIRFFRVAYGNAPRGTTLDRSEINSVLEDYFQGGRVSAKWHSEIKAQRTDIKLIFLAIQCVETALPYGGVIDVSLVGKEWVIRAENPKLKITQEHWALLEGQDIGGELLASQVQFGMLAMLCEWRKPALSLTRQENLIEIRL